MNHLDEKMGSHCCEAVALNEWTDGVMAHHDHRGNNGGIRSAEKDTIFTTYTQRRHGALEDEFTGAVSQAEHYKTDSKRTRVLERSRMPRVSRADRRTK
jgi:hypothetical protein